VRRAAEHRRQRVVDAQEAAVDAGDGARPGTPVLRGTVEIAAAGHNRDAASVVLGGENDASPGGEQAGVEDLVKFIENLLFRWLMGYKKAMYNHFMNLGPKDRLQVSNGLRILSTKSANDEYRRAAKEIPEYIKSKL